MYRLATFRFWCSFGSDFLTLDFFRSEGASCAKASLGVAVDATCIGTGGALTSAALLASWGGTMVGALVSKTTFAGHLRSLLMRIAGRSPAVFLLGAPGACGTIALTIKSSASSAPPT